MMRTFFSNENGDQLRKKEENLSDSRSNDDFLHQSVEIGSFFKPLPNDQIVLIKYKNAPDSDTGLNWLRASQLQKQREIKSLLIFIFFLFVTIITLSQILVMHSSTKNSNFYQIKLMQEELKLMDLSINRMLKEKHVLSIQTWTALKKYNQNLKIFSSYMENLNESIFLSHSNTSHCKKFLSSNIHLSNNENIDTSNISKILAEIDQKLNGFSNQTVACLEPIVLNLLYALNRKYSSLHEQNYKQFAKLDRVNLINQTLTHFKNKSSFIENYLPIRDLTDLMNKYQKKKFNRFTNLSLCEPQPPILYGRVKVEERKANRALFDKMEIENKEVKFGGFWSPKNCQARHKVAIIIPYRDRKDHLFTLLSYLHPILQRQQLDYKIYVSEQIGNGTFNKAIVMNAAFIYALEQDNYNCYCFHDVDLIPEDDRNMYSCGRHPKHMSIGVDEMNYVLQYEELIGGVLILNTEHVLASNGYSNLYWGWGAEDDDLYYRLKGLGYKIERPPLKIGRYTMMKHKKRKPQLWSKRAKLLYSSVNRMTWDGVSSAKYTLMNVTERRFYTHLLIDVGQPPEGFN